MQGTLTIGLILEYIQLWDLLNVIHLQRKVEDSHIWKLTATGKYLAKSGLIPRRHSIPMARSA
jgi:hypothetical protein